MNREELKEIAKRVGVSVAVTISVKMGASLVEKGLKVAKAKLAAYKEKKLEDVICED